MGRTPALTDQEVAQQRDLTPGAHHVAHFNHAGSSLPTQAVLDAQVNYLTNEAHIGGYEAAAESQHAHDAVYDSIASFIGAGAGEIARAEHATTAWNAAFWSLPMEAGQRILTVEAEYGANAVAFLRAKERYGIEIEVVASAPQGQVDLDAFEKALCGDVALVALTHVPTNGGLVNPAAEVGALTKAAGVPYLLDACQSVGQLNIDVSAIGCDLLSASGRKYLRGPRGSGFLYANSEILTRLKPNQPDHHGAPWISPDRYEFRDDARRFEYWEFNHASWHGLGVAVEHAQSIGIDRIESTIEQRADELRTALAEHGLPTFDIGVQRCGIVTTNVPGVEPAEAKAALREQHINVSVTDPATTWWDATRRELTNMLRVSVHYTTTSDEIDQVVTALRELER